jgi:hypothetical protein
MSGLAIAIEIAQKRHGDGVYGTGADTAKMFDGPMIVSTVLRSRLRPSALSLVVVDRGIPGLETA